MIKAVIFDFFGVLADHDSTSFRKAYLAGDPIKDAEAQRLNDELGRGDLGYDDFIDGLAKLGAVRREDVLVYTEDYQPNQRLLDFIHDDLRPRYKSGIISNAGQDWVLKILGEDNLKLFDDVILSYKVKMIKPDPGIYELSARNLGVRTEECVFVDDILRYCQGAEHIGMSTVWYQNFGDFKTELEKILAAGSNN